MGIVCGYRLRESVQGIRPVAVGLAGHRAVPVAELLELNVLRLSCGISGVVYFDETTSI